MTSPMTDAERESYDHVKQFLNYVFRPGSLLEIRGLYPAAAQTRGVMRCLTANPTLAAKVAILALRRSPSLALYYAINPIDPQSEYARESEKEKAFLQEMHTAKDRDVTHRAVYLIDIDPVRPSGVCSTDPEKEQAWIVAQRVRAHLLEQGWPEPIVVDSGNGYHLLYRGDGCDPSGRIWRFVLKHLAALYNTGTAKVDISVFNAARIARLPGTWNRKGEDTPGRPHRQARVLAFPSSFDAVPAYRLHHSGIEGDCVSENDRKGKSSARGAKSELAIDGEGILKLIADFPEVLTLDRVTETEDITYFALAECPFAGRAHRDQNVGYGKTTIMLRPDSIGFSCFSDDCSEHTIGNLLRLLRERTGRRPPKIWEDRLDSLLEKWGIQPDGDDFVSPPVGESEDSEEDDDLGKIGSNSSSEQAPADIKGRPISAEEFQIMVDRPDYTVDRPDYTLDRLVFMKDWPRLFEYEAPEMIELILTSPCGDGGWQPWVSEFRKWLLEHAAIG
ncbi:MAG: hypothetical protein ACRD4Q_02440 [Candidatus Acidiferrales bacterium]